MKQPDVAAHVFDPAAQVRRIRSSIIMTLLLVAAALLLQRLR